MAEITPASFADLKKAWDFWRHHKDQDRPVTDTPNYRTYRLEFLRGIDQIKTQAKTDALRDAAESNDLISHMYREYGEHPQRSTLAPAAIRATSKYLHNQANQMEDDDAENRK